MSTGIDLKGVTEVLSQFDYRDTPFFAVYQGKDLKFENNEDDIEAARAMLNTHLEQLANNGSQAPFKIVWYKKLRPDGERPDPNSLLGSNTFRVVPIGMNMQNFYAMQRGDEIPFKISGKDDSNSKILELLNGIDSRLTAIENPLEEELDSEEEQTPTQKILGAISGVISHPSVQELLASKLVGLLNLIPTPAAMGQAPAATKQITMPIEEKDLPELNDQLQILIQYGMGLEDFKKLANIAKSNNSQFNMLLTMLRNS
jgi:hypothetical protein